MDRHCPQDRQPWWRTGVVYQIYPRSFADASGNGIGDLAGIRARLDYLTWLGVDALWLSPIYRSPMADAGYDISDHCDVDPLFGDLDGFNQLLAEAHDHGLKVMLDWVPNHTSDQHPWFIDSRSSRTSPYRNWYFWRDGRGSHDDGGNASGGNEDDGVLRDQPPNNWTTQFSDDPAWTYDAETAQWYLHLFLPEQPDLNWGHPAAREAMHEVLRFWLRRGVDGFRADVVHLIGKKPDLPDRPPEELGTKIVHSHDVDYTHELLRDIRGVLEEFDGERPMVGEINLRSAQQISSYYGSGDELHMAFNFAPMQGPWEAGFWRSAIHETLDAYRPIDAWPTWVLSNHDNPRHRTRYGGSEANARAAAVLLLTLPGTPFLYAGEELGMEDADVPEDERVDPAGRDGCRAPLPWIPGRGHSWPPDPWLPFAPQPEERNVQSQQQDADSVLHLYRRILAVRKESPALQSGAWEEITTPPDVLGYERSSGDDHRIVLVNFADRAVEVPLHQPATVRIASDGNGEGRTFRGLLDPSQAVILA